MHEVSDRQLLGRRVRQQLGRMERSGAWLARHLEVHPSTVSNWIRGTREPSISQLRCLAEQLAVPVGWLVGESTSTQPEFDQNAPAARSAERIAS